MTIRLGDTVFHRPSAEEWVVLYVEGAATGHPLLTETDGGAVQMIDPERASVHGYEGMEEDDAERVACQIFDLLVSSGQEP